MMNPNSDYHAERARIELDRVSDAPDDESAGRHLELASRHLARSQSARFIEQLEKKASSGPRAFWHTDKEA
jgi:hypothetical protein